jgi:hypothetical protein
MRIACESLSIRIVKTLLHVLLDGFDPRDVADHIRIAETQPARLPKTVYLTRSA